MSIFLPAQKSSLEVFLNIWHYSATAQLLLSVEGFFWNANGKMLSTLALDHWNLAFTQKDNSQLHTEGSHHRAILTFSLNELCFYS